MMQRFDLAAKALVFALVFAAASQAQVQFNVTYQEVIDGTNAGFNDATIAAGETLSRGQLRRNTINAVTAYMATVFDGRGTVNLHWDVSNTTPGGPLAQFGPNGFAGIDGNFQNGMAYQALRTNVHPFTDNPPTIVGDAQGNFDFTSYQYNYTGGLTNNGTKFDMFSVALHEFSHGMGFISGTSPNGSGLNGNAPGTPDIYTGYDKFLQRGNGAGGSLFNTTITDANYGSFTGNASTFTNGNDAATGLFFGGKYAREVFLNPVPLFAPNPYQNGSSVGHTNTGTPGVMHPSIPAGTVRNAYRDYEIAMLLDIGYNVYNWNASQTANWTGGNVNSLAASPWRTDMGIIYSGPPNFELYNVNSSQGQAPILAPYGQVTSNIVLNFAGTSAYTATNDIAQPIRMSRINLNSTAGAASTIFGGTLRFGQNSDGTFSVLRPKIVQENSGAFNIGSTIQIDDPTRGLTVDGPGTGTLNFTGNLTGAGGLTKAGTFTMIMAGGANNYSGATVINQGILRINGLKSGTGTVTINNTGRLQGTGAVAGLTTVNAGGVIAPGASVGNLTFTSGLTMNAGNYSWELASLTTSGGGTNFDVISLTGGTSTFGGSSSVTLDFGLLAAGSDPNGANAFWNSPRQWEIVDLLSGAFSGNFGSITNPNWTRGSFFLSSGVGGIFLNFTTSPVPEPGAFILLSLAGGAWLLLRRRS